MRCLRGKKNNNHPLMSIFLITEIENSYCNCQWPWQVHVTVIKKINKKYFCWESVWLSHSILIYLHHRKYHLHTQAAVPKTQIASVQMRTFHKQHFLYLTRRPYPLSHRGLCLAEPYEMCRPLLFGHQQRRCWLADNDAADVSPGGRVHIRLQRKWEALMVTDSKQCQSGWRQYERW